VLLKNYPAFFGTRWFTTAFTRDLPPVSIYSQIIPFMVCIRIAFYNEPNIQGVPLATEPGISLIIPTYSNEI
jgi:hypothetical protein